MLSKWLVAASFVFGTLFLTTQVLAQDNLLKNTQWDTRYTDPNGDDVQSMVTLKNTKGAYESFTGGQSVGDGTLSQVRVEVDK